LPLLVMVSARGDEVVPAVTLPKSRRSGKEQT
jgi:hypothetical protein